MRISVGQKRDLKFILSGVILLGLSACKTQTVQEYFVDYNKHSTHKVLEGQVHRLTITPIDSLTSLLMASAIDPETRLTDSVWKALKAEHPNVGVGRYFTFKIELIDSTSPGVLPGLKPDVEYNPSGLGADFKTQIMYYLDGMRAHLWFECGQYEYPLDYYQFERAWGMVPYRNIQLGSSRVNSDCYLVLENPLPNMGKHKILIKDLE